MWMIVTLLVTLTLAVPATAQAQTPCMVAAADLPGCRYDQAFLLGPSSFQRQWVGLPRVEHLSRDALDKCLVSATGELPSLGSQDDATAVDAYRIGPEDQLLISVWKNDAMSRSVLVRPDGKIALPPLNDVPAAGLTALELRDVLTTKLKDFIPNPEVTVIVSDVRSLRVSVIGGASRPGQYELKRWATVLDVLALCGGLR
jgi:protein involved in polysaccharide export with SLBB domain